MKKVILAATLMATTSIMAMPELKAEDINPNLHKLKEMREMMRAQGVEIGLPMMQETPSEGYQGPDKQKLLDMTVAEWKSTYPQDEVLGARIHMNDWERRTEKRWNTTGDAYMVNYSEIQVLVFVKKDNMKATAWPVNATKDHSDSDKLAVDASGVKSVDLMSQDIFLKNLKL
jgi:hypothetical protein